MKPKYKSIGRKLKTSRTPEHKFDVVHEWAVSWQSDFDTCITNLEHAVDDQNPSSIESATRVLKMAVGKRLDVLPDIIVELKSAADEMAGKVEKKEHDDG